MVRDAVVALFGELVPPDPETGCRYSCRACYFLSHGQEEMVLHVEEVHQPQDPVTCPYCKKSYKNKESLAVHISLKHRELHAKVNKKAQQQSNLFHN